MSYKIKKAAVLGAGVMGATIAAHLTNAGIECVLLDIIPFELTEADKAQGVDGKKPGLAEPVRDERAGRCREVQTCRILHQEERLNGQGRQFRGQSGLACRCRLGH